MFPGMLPSLFCSFRCDQPPRLPPPPILPAQEDGGTLAIYNVGSVGQVPRQQPGGAAVSTSSLTATAGAAAEEEKSKGGRGSEPVGDMLSTTTPPRVPGSDLDPGSGSSHTQDPVPSPLGLPPPSPSPPASLPSTRSALGALGLGWAAGEPATCVAPLGARLVVFESTIEHEVLPAHAPRYRGVCCVLRAACLPGLGGSGFLFCYTSSSPHLPHRPSIHAPNPVPLRVSIPSPAWRPPPHALLLGLAPPVSRPNWLQPPQSADPNWLQPPHPPPTPHTHPWSPPSTVLHPARRVHHNCHSLLRSQPHYYLLQPDLKRLATT